MSESETIQDNDESKSWYEIIIPSESELKKSQCDRIKECEKIYHEKKTIFISKIDKIRHKLISSIKKELTEYVSTITYLNYSKSHCITLTKPDIMRSIDHKLYQEYDELYENYLNSQKKTLIEYIMDPIISNLRGLNYKISYYEALGGNTVTRYIIAW